ncbi:MAG: hypothetical protein RL662_628 [Bacteroidota bacterium]|jgi:hypothetical protein
MFKYVVMLNVILVKVYFFKVSVRRNDKMFAIFVKRII